jgi:hypothetical protein
MKGLGKTLRAGINQYATHKWDATYVSVCPGSQDYQPFQLTTFTLRSYKSSAPKRRKVQKDQKLSVGGKGSLINAYSKAKSHNSN